MIAKMTVHEVRDVEIPDLPASVMKIIAKYGGKVSLGAGLQECSDNSRSYYAEVWFDIEEPDNLHGEGHSADAFWETLQGCPEYDESVMTRDTLWFQSDSDDGIGPCRLFVQAMKAAYPNVTFT